MVRNRGLFLKMCRDMGRSGMTYALCIFIVAIGFCGYCVLSLASGDLFRAQEQFMRDTAFPEAFAEVERATAGVTRRLEEIPGIRKAQGRLVKEVRLEKLGRSEDLENVKLRMYSFEADGLNVPLVSGGRLPGAGAREVSDGRDARMSEAGARELLLGDGMAQARGLKQGDSLEAVIGGARVNFSVTGTGSTPENIYLLENTADLFPAPERYDAAFVEYQTMAGLFSMEGLANSFEFLLEPGVDFKKVEPRIREVLEPYGCLRVYDRSGEMSSAMLQTELEQLGRMTGVIPFLFLTVAAVVLFISLGRLIEQQRPQIGMLMAMGFTQQEIRLHYSLYGALTGLLGGTAGGLAGYACSGPMADFYREYFRLPASRADLPMSYLLIGAAAAAAFCAGVSFLAAGRIARLSPAAALRPAAPGKAKHFMLERIPGFSGLLTEPGLMAVRSLARNKKKAALSVFGIAFAFMITATLVSMNSLYDVFIFDYWEKTQRQDLTVRFDGYVGEREAEQAVRRAEIRQMEGILELPVTLKGRTGISDGSIQGIEEDSQLCLLYSEDGGQAYPSGDGILLSRHTADRIGAEAGSLITVTFQYPEKKDCPVRVAGVITQYMGDTAYMERKTAGRLSGAGDAVSAVLVTASGPVQEEIREHLKDAEKVAAVENRGERAAGLRALVGSLSGMMGAMAAMGAVISTAVFYISSLIGFEETKRELAVLLTLGVPADVCLDAVSVSQWILAAAGAAAGIPLTMAVSRLMSKTMVSDLYSIPSFVDGWSVAVTIVLTALSVWIGTEAILFKIKKITPAELLRERE